MTYDPRRYWQELTDRTLAGTPCSDLKMMTSGERVEFLREHVSGYVLDAGCGYGRWSKILKGCYSAYLGVDVVPRRIEYAREHYGTDTAEFQCVPADRPWCINAGFDVAFTSNVLMHLPVPDCLRLLWSMAASVRSGGKLVLWDNVEDRGKKTAPHVIKKTLDELRIAVPTLERVGDCRFVAEIP